MQRAGGDVTALRIEFVRELRRFAAAGFALRVVHGIVRHVDQEHVFHVGFSIKGHGKLRLRNDVRNELIRLRYGPGPILSSGPTISLCSFAKRRTSWLVNFGFLAFMALSA